MTSVAAGQRLPALDRRIDIAAVELHRATAPAGALSGDQRRPAAEKGVEHDVAAGRAVKDCVGNHRDRLHRRMQRQQITLLAAAGEGVAPRVAPDVSAAAAELAELDIVAVPVTAIFEDKDQLVLAAVERAHP